MNLLSLVFALLLSCLIMFIFIGLRSLKNKRLKYVLLVLIEIFLVNIQVASAQAILPTAAIKTPADNKKKPMDRPYFDTDDNYPSTFYAGAIAYKDSVIESLEKRIDLLEKELQKAKKKDKKRKRNGDLIKLLTAIVSIVSTTLIVK